MTTWRNALQCVVYWSITGVLGAFCLVYLTIRTLLDQYKGKPKENRVKQMQPLCLSEASFGNHKYFKNQGVKIHYVESGAENAKVVILIHGTPGFWFCWRKQIPELARYFRVIALDLRGCGDSESPNRRKYYKKETIIQDIVYLIGSLGCASACIVCSETSGYLGWELASTYPQLVSKLVLINFPHPFVLHYLFHEKLYYYFQYWYLLLLQIPILPEVAASSDQTKGWLQSLLDPQVKAKAITEEEIDAYKYAFSRKDDWRGVINHLRQIDLRPLRTMEQPPRLSTPTLLLMGSNHPHLPVDAAFRSAVLVEQIDVKVIPNAGLHLQVTHAKRVSSELIEFISPPRKPIPILPPEPKQSLVGRVFGAVTSSYQMKNTDVDSISTGLKGVAQSTYSTGVSLAQTAWLRN